MSFSGKLHPYQVEDKDYMLSRGNLMLAYGQGTGKTVMMIAAIEEAMDSGLVHEPGLIVCMAAQKEQWRQAIHQWTGGHQEVNPKTGLLEWVGGSSNPLVISGTPVQRTAQYAEARAWNKEGGVDYIILSYDQVANDWTTVRKLPRGFVVLDEATMIKNPRAKRTRRVKRLASDLRFALTGTPIENGKPEEYFSIMQWLDEDVLGRWDIFDKAFIVRDQYGRVKRYRNIPVFNESIAPAMRRRTREDPEVAPYFPKTPAEHAPITVKLGPAATKAYKHIAQELADDLRQVLTAGPFEIGLLYGFGDMQGNSLQGNIMQKRMALQMLVDHPDLLRASAEKFSTFVKTGAKGGSRYIADLVAQGILDDVTQTPKMNAAMEWLDDILEADPANKVVIFSTYVDTLHYFQARMKCDSVIFHGGMNDKQKAAAMGKFKQDPDCRVFISSDAGGYGIDLPEANYLLNYSFPEKWGTSDQRETRIIRASSKWESVYVRRIVVAGSIDVLKYNRLISKGKVSTAFLEGKGYDEKGRLVMMRDKKARANESSPSDQANDAVGLLEFLTEGAGYLKVKAKD